MNAWRVQARGTLPGKNYGELVPNGLNNSIASQDELIGAALSPC